MSTIDRLTTSDSGSFTRADGERAIAITRWVTHSCKGSVAGKSLLVLSAKAITAVNGRRLHGYWQSAALT